MEDHLLNNQQRAKNLILIFWVLLGATVVALISDYMELTLLTSGDISTEAAESNDTRQQIVALIQLPVMITTFVLYIMWFRRAYCNLHRINVPALLFSEGWAAGSWFVPFLNLVRPYQIMKEIWNETQSNTAGKTEIQGTSLIGWWWAFFLIGNVYDNITARIQFSADTIEELTNASTMDIIGAFIEIPSILIAVSLVKKVSEFETELYNSRESTDLIDHLISN